MRRTVEEQHIRSDIKIISEDTEQSSIACREFMYFAFCEDKSSRLINSSESNSFLVKKATAASYAPFHCINEFSATGGLPTYRIVELTITYQTGPCN